MADYWKLYQQVKLFFAETKEIFCPALKASIKIDLSGFRHIQMKRGVKRTIPEQIRRFKLIPLVHVVLNDINTVVEKYGNYYSLSSHVESRVVTIVLVGINNTYRFLSIMEKTKKAR